jgi:subtilisin family serine protease
MSVRLALEHTLQELASRELAPVEVAVVDSGVDATHPDLAGRVVRAYRAEVVGDEATLTEQPVGENLDAYGHGTAVASIVARVAPNARIVDIRVLNPGNVGAGKALLRGFEHAVESQIRVVNLSLAATATFASALHALCERAYRANQVIVAAKRNMPLADNGFPAELSSCISVDIGRVAHALEVQYREDHPIEFAGYGENVPCAAAGGGYTTMTGTSFASPAVSGLCALLVGAYPSLRPFDLKSLLRAFALQGQA